MHGQMDFCLNKTNRNDRDQNLAPFTQEESL